MIIATLFAIKVNFYGCVYLSPKDNMQVKGQNLIPLKLQGKEQVRRQRQWRERLFLSNICLEEEKHHKELVCAKSLRSGGELVSWNRYGIECSILYTWNAYILFICLMYNSKYYLEMEFPV